VPKESAKLKNIEQKQVNTRKSFVYHCKMCRLLLRELLGMKFN